MKVVTDYIKHIFTALRLLGLEAQYPLGPINTLRFEIVSIIAEILSMQSLQKM